MKRRGVRIASNGDYWQAVWYDDLGRRRVRSLGAKASISRAQAQAMADELYERMVRLPGVRNARGGLKLSDWIDEVARLRADDLSEGTIRGYRETQTWLARHFGADVRLDRITPLHAARWRAWLLGQGLAPGTVARHARNAKTICRLAIKYRLLGADPFAELPGNAAPTTLDDRVLTDDEVGRLIDAAPSIGWRTLLALCAYAGVRRGEAKIVRWDAVQWDRNRIIVPQPKVAETTGRATRPVLMEPVLQSILLDAREASGRGIEIVEGVSLCNAHRTMHVIMRRAGVEAYSQPFHALRKWRATSWRRTYPENVVDAWLGHSAEVARRHYAKIEERWYGGTDRVAELEAEVERLRAQLGAQNATYDNASEDDRAQVVVRQRAGEGI